jgi:hypothetical protein
MIVRQHSKSGGAGDLLDYLIINREIDEVRASRVADIAVHNLPVMPTIPKSADAARELVRALTHSIDSFMSNARLSSVRILKNNLIHVIISFELKDPPKIERICGGPIAVARELVKNVVSPNRAMIFALHDSNQHGAKLVYVLLAQKVSIKGIARVFIPALAVELGDEDAQVNQFLIELESYGLLEIQKPLAESEALQCIFPAHPWAGEGEAYERQGDRASKHSGRPSSRHSRESCLQFAKAKQQAGEKIQNVYALATYFHQTGYHDEELDIFLNSGTPDTLPPNELSNIQ